MLTTNHEIEGHHLGPIDHLADVLVSLVENRRFVSKQPVGGNQLRGLVLSAIKSTIQLGEEEMNLVRRLFLYQVKLKHLYTKMENMLTSID